MSSLVKTCKMWCFGEFVSYYVMFSIDVQDVVFFSLCCNMPRLVRSYKMWSFLGVCVVSCQI